MKITIIGAGNIGTLMAAELAHKGHEVTIFTSRPEQWETEIKVYNAEEEFLFSGCMSKITDSIQDAMREAQYIWITMPAQMFSELGKKMLPYVRRTQKIGIVPGCGGAEFAFGECIENGVTLFGLQRVHSIARLKRYGSSVYELGRKAELQIGALPFNKTAEVCKSVEKMFAIPCTALTSYLSVTLTPSNPILHTARLYSMFKDYEPDRVYPRNFLFYEEWTDASSEILIACDKELQRLCNAIPIDLSGVKSLREYYESKDIEAMTKKISGIKAFKGLTSPMKEIEKGWVPDWNSRYFTTDFSYGLKVIKDIAEIFSIATPTINAVWNWYISVLDKNNIKESSIKVSTENFTKIYGITLKEKI